MMLLREELKKPKIKIQNHLETLPFKQQLEVNEAIRSRSEQKKLNRTNQNCVYYNPKEAIKLVKDFEDKYKLNLEQHKEIKKENDIFLNKYNNAKKNENLKRDNAFENIFPDLIIKYKEKGFSNEDDIKVKNNLFELSPLLIKNSKIKDFYKLESNYELYEKDLEYTKKLKEIINEKLMIDEKSKNINNLRLISDRYVKIESENEIELKSPREIIKEIEMNEEAIKKSINIMENKEYKTIFKDYSNKKLLKTKAIINSPNKNMNTNPKILVTSKTIINTKSKDLEKMKNLSNPIQIDKSQPVNNSSTQNEDDIFSELDNLPQSSIMNRQRNNTSSIIKLTKNNNILRLSPNILKRKKKQSEISLNSVFNDEKRRIKYEIEDKINSKSVPELERLQEKIINKEFSHKEILDYLVKKAGKDRNVLEEGLKKKIGPTDVMKYIADLKAKVLLVDFNESYKNFTSKSGFLDINMNGLAKISEMDKKIYMLDYQLIKDLNQIAKK